MIGNDAAEKSFGGPIVKPRSKLAGESVDVGLRQFQHPLDRGADRLAFDQSRKQHELRL